ncbi:TerB family tellurite resistance protein [Maribacter polysaccharolyticus]|uniref:TerB family tellurite resistance protein n=1 Tax=Maribacter polysaccharolyticus TaxID=3020831 RepID=UPI00237F5D73|nr:TerB family tellurite resistance protein [Maribacter polysaccharolyticus]MDE3741876.1 TerB family tellurite resistance protein [Maribacter polysaccharolyticus]
MPTSKEKLSILSEMIAFAKVKNNVKPEEYAFLNRIAEQLGVGQETFESLFHKEVEYVIPKSEADRILQFHRLVLLMNVDKKQDQNEIDQIHNIGLGMGLPPAAIESVLTVMHQYPDKIIPPNVLIDIFKTYYN